MIMVILTSNHFPAKYFLCSGRVVYIVMDMVGGGVLYLIKEIYLNI